jgi:hypothetical protein
MRIYLFLGILNCLFLHHLYESAMSRAVGIGVWNEDKAQEGQHVCSPLMSVTKSQQQECTGLIR